MKTMKLRTGRYLLAFAIILLAAPIATRAQSNDYPTRPISLTVPYGAGGGADIMARLVGSFLEKKFGKQVGIINKPGAGGALGFREIATSTPDGYKIGVINLPDSAIVTAQKGDKAGFTNDSFILLGNFARSPFVLATMKTAPFASIKEFQEYAKKNPGKVSVAISGTGHLLALLAMKSELGIDVNPVMFKSAGENFNSLLGGHVMASMVASQFVITGENKGVVGLASTGDKRIDKLPKVPTFKESGFNVLFEVNRIFVAPAGTPPAIVATLISNMEDLVKDKDFVAKLDSIGEDFGPLFKSELDAFYKNSCSAISSIVMKNAKDFE